MVAFVANACSSPLDSNRLQRKLTPVPNITSTPAMVSTPAFVSPTSTLPLLPYNPSPIPTDLPEQEMQLIEKLQEKDCTLPCYLGITPGRTTLSAAQAVMDIIGAHDIGDLTRGNFETYTYVAYVDSASELDKTPEPNDFANIIDQGVTLIATNGIVQGIEVDAGTNWSLNPVVPMTKFRQYWSRYSTQEIFIQLGIPDHLYVDGANPSYAASEEGR
ncbi:MAG: hypothetical protein WBW94_07900, partial [Anaerolineales bacterium]